MKRSWSLKIWTWFGFSPTDKAQTTVICKVCREEVRTSDGNTTNLFNHLRRQHPKQYAESQRARKTATLQSETASAKPKQKTLTQAFDKGSEDLLALQTSYSFCTTEFTRVEHLIFCFDIMFFLCSCLLKTKLI